MSTSLEGASPLTLESVRFVKADGRPDSAATLPAIQSTDDERAAAARPGARVFALFLDEYHVAPEATARVKELARAFVNEQVGAGDLMIVLRPLDPLLALRLTRDREAVLREVDEFEGRLGQYEPRNAFERDFVAGDPVRVEATRAQITALCASRARDPSGPHRGCAQDRSGDHRRLCATRRSAAAASCCRRSTRSFERRTTPMFRGIRSILAPPPSPPPARRRRRQQPGGPTAGDGPPARR